MGTSETATKNREIVLDYLRSKAQENNLFYTKSTKIANEESINPNEAGAALLDIAKSGHYEEFIIEKWASSKNTTWKVSSRVQSE